MTEISEDIMEIAHKYALEYTINGNKSFTNTIARAILHERERCARLVEVGFTRPGVKTKMDKCPHDRYKWEDCEQCAADAIRRGERPPVDNMIRLEKELEAVIFDNIEELYEP